MNRSLSNLLRILLGLLVMSLAANVWPAQSCTTSQIGGNNIDFEGISGSSDANVITVGENGSVYRYDGSSWNSMASGTTRDLNDVFVLAANLAYAVGKNGTIIVYNGSNWSAMNSGTTQELNGVWAYSNSDVWAVGKNGVILHYNGTAWQSLSGAANTGGSELEDAWGNAGFFYALSKNGNLYRYDRSGASWSTITTCASIIGDDVKDLWGDAAGNVYIAGKNGAVYFYNGSTCSRVANGGEDLEGIYGSAATGEIYTVGDSGTVVYYNGSAWTSTTEGNRDIKDVWVSSSGNAYYAAKNGYTSTCTYTTAPVTACSTTTVPGADDFNSISGSSTNHVISVGKDGDVYTYDGTSWSRVTIAGNPNDDLEDVYVIDSANAVTVGKEGTVILQSSGTWSVLAAPTSKDLYGVWAYSTSEIYVFGRDGALYRYNGSWSNQQTSAGTNNQDDFEDAWGNASYVYGLTRDGNMFRYSRPSGPWSEITTCNIGGSVEFYDLWGDTAGNIYLAGKNNNDGIIYRYNGSSCSLVATANADRLAGIYGSTVTGEIYAVGQDGTVMYFNGSTWSQSSVGSEDLIDVWVSSNGTPFYAGKNATLTTCAQTASFHHVVIEHDGSALTCEPETITLRACADSSCSSLYSGNVTVDLTPSGWVGGNSQTIVSGQSTVQFRNTTATTVNYAVSGSSPAATAAFTCLNTANSTNSCAQTFYDSGFIYSIPTQTACETSTPITLRAVRLDDTSQACVPTFNSQSRDITFSLSYVNPNSGTRSLTLNHGVTDYTPINNVTSQTVPVSFDINGQATFTVNYPDAGSISLNSQYAGSVATSDSGLSMTGSATFLNKPYKLLVFADEANADCAASSPTCSTFKRAGEAFNLRVRAACSDDTVTPNFQLNNLTLTHLNTAPAIAQGTLDISNFNIEPADQGEHLITQTVSEVGAYTFTASLPAGDYFGEPVGDSTLNTSNIIGRFYPDHFCLTANLLVNRTDSDTASACTDGFSYLDEDFDARFTLSAQAMGQSCGSGSVTQNYDGAWSKFATPFSENTSLPAESGKWNLAAVNDPAGTPLNLNSRIELNTSASTPSNGQFSNGTLDISARLNINRSGSAPGFTHETPLSNVHIGINPIDTDNVAIDSTNLAIAGNNYRDLGNLSLFFGRLFAENAFGSNMPDIGLDMYARTEYCNAVSAGSCTQWLPKADDSCSLYNINPPAGVESRANPLIPGLPGYYRRASASVSSGIFDFTDDGTGPSYARVHVPDTSNHSSGWRLIYTAGGDGGDFVIPYRFPFNADPTVHPYLLHVNGIATFGQFRGDDRIIYWREVLE